MDRRGSPLRPQGAVRLAALVLAAGLALAAVAAEAQTSSRVKLVVVKSGAGSVESDDGAIRCGSRCAARFPRGKLVRLFAGSGSLDFAGWSGACVGSMPVCDVAMDAGRRVRATFELRRLVQITVGGGGTVTSEPPGLRCGSAGGVCEARFAVGSTVALVVEPDPGHEFASWSGSCSDPEATRCELIVPDAFPPPSVAGAFRRTGGQIGDPRLTAHGPMRSSPPGIDCPPVCIASFAPATVVTFENRAVNRWRGACVGTAPLCRVVVDEPTEIWVTIGHPGGGGETRLGLAVTVAGRGTVTDGEFIRCGKQARSVRDCLDLLSGGQSSHYALSPPVVLALWGGVDSAMDAVAVASGLRARC